jgi:integrase
VRCTSLVRRLARDAGIEAWDQLSPHCLRHSAITFAQRARTPPKLMERMGHEDGSVQSRYDHITAGMRRALVAALIEMWEEALGARRTMSPGSPVAVLDALLKGRE